MNNLFQRKNDSQDVIRKINFNVQHTIINIIQVNAMRNILRKILNSLKLRNLITLKVERYLGEHSTIALTL